MVGKDEGQKLLEGFVFSVKLKEEKNGGEKELLKVKKKVKRKKMD